MLTPREYQQQAIDIMKRRNWLLNDECGLGKTLQAIEAAKALQLRIGKPVLIVCPKSIREQWRNSLINQGVEASQIGYAGCDTLWQVYHYEALVKHASTLARGFYATIICDEAHRIKNRQAKRSIAIKQLSAYRKIALTGTPYDRNPADIWSIFNWLEPEFFRSYWVFYNAHINYIETYINRTTKVKVIDQKQPLKDAENFARLLRQYSLKRTKKEVREDIPDRIDQYIDLEMSKAQLKYYSDIANAEDLIVDVGDQELIISIVLTRILRLIQVTSDPTLLDLKAPSVKLEWLHDWLEDNDSESVIIFTRFKELAVKLQKELGDKFKLIVGGKTRPTITSEDRYIIGTIAAMGEGLDLPHIDNAIFIDVEWSSILMQQAIDRIHRINIQTVKNVYYLRCKDTVDLLVHSAISQKWDTKALVDRFLQSYAK